MPPEIVCMFLHERPDGRLETSQGDYAMTPAGFLADVPGCSLLYVVVWALVTGGSCSAGRRPSSSRSSVESPPLELSSGGRAMRANPRAVRDAAAVSPSASWVDAPGAVVFVYSVWLMVLDGVRG